MMRRLWVVLVLAVASAACSERMVGGPDGGRDGGPIATDGGTGDAGRVDASVPDAAALDGGVDAGEPPPPPCSCPAYPTSCAAPAASEPTFTPPARGMGEQLFALIACAETSLQIAMYEAEWPCIADALSTALEQNPDLAMEVVVDNTRCAPGSCLFDALEATGRVTLVRDTRSAFMHHKWVIADGERVWISSGNFSERSYCIDHNNALIVDEPDIVDRYETIFEGMLAGGFSPSVQPVASANGYTVWTSPHSPTTQPAEWETAIVAAIDAAETRIDVMMNAFTVTAYSDALIAAHDRGVTVRLLVSSIYAREEPAQAILAAGIPSRRGNIHDKVVIVDDRVFTGSANWSVNARSNNEHVLSIEDPTVAAAYRADFDAVFEASREVTPAP